MEQQKVFATAMLGFDKKAVLDYIYELDCTAKKKDEEQQLPGRRNMSASWNSCGRSWKKVKASVRSWSSSIFRLRRSWRN